MLIKHVQYENKYYTILYYVYFGIIALIYILEFNNQIDYLWEK